MLIAQKVKQSIVTWIVWFSNGFNLKDDDQNDLERIGKSFRQLSQSLMCTDGTELFGDLPSPRLNFRAT